MGTFRTAVHDIQSSHEASQAEFAERPNALSNDMREVHVNTQERTKKEELQRIKDVTDISKQSGKFKMKTAQAKYWKDRAESLKNGNVLLT